MVSDPEGLTPADRSGEAVQTAAFTDEEIGAGFVVLEPVDPAGDAAQLAANFATVTFIGSSYDVVAPENADAIGALGDLIAAL